MIDSTARILQIVREHLERRPYERGPRPTVALEPERDGEYWFIPVSTDRQPANTFDYYEYLAEVEGEIEEEEELNVVLVPCYPDDPNGEDLS